MYGSGVYGGRFWGLGDAVFSLVYDRELSSCAGPPGDIYAAIRRALAVEVESTGPICAPPTSRYP